MSKSFVNPKNVLISLVKRCFIADNNAAVDDVTVVELVNNSIVVHFFTLSVIRSF